MDVWLHARRFVVGAVEARSQEADSFLPLYPIRVQYALFWESLPRALAWCAYWWPMLNVRGNGSRSAHSSPSWYQAQSVASYQERLVTDLGNPECKVLAEGCCDMRGWVDVHTPHLAHQALVRWPGVQSSPTLLSPWPFLKGCHDGR